MALRSEVQRKDNSKLGRAVLNNRENQQRHLQAGNTETTSVVAKKTPITEKVTKKVVKPQNRR